METTGLITRHAWAVVAASTLLVAAGCGRGEPPSEAGQQQAQLYTCGMHPEVVQDVSGDCPICGMDLVEKER
jgi:hypothetical protein